LRRRQAANQQVFPLATEESDPQIDLLYLRRGQFRTGIAARYVSSGFHPLARFPAMTERERWIVYPLLFLALGASLRDKLFERASASKGIICQKLTVVDEDDRILAQIGSADRDSADDEPKGLLQVNGNIAVFNGVVGILDRDPGGHRPLRELATLGLSRPAAPGGNSQGSLIVRGRVEANAYTMHSVPMIPTFRAFVPGLIPGPAPEGEAGGQPTTPAKEGEGAGGGEAGDAARQGSAAPNRLDRIP
jgi:hypothetical protein